MSVYHPRNFPHGCSSPEAPIRSYGTLYHAQWLVPAKQDLAPSGTRSIAYTMVLL